MQNLAYPLALPNAAGTFIISWPAGYGDLTIAAPSLAGTTLEKDVTGAWVALSGPLTAGGLLRVIKPTGTLTLNGYVANYLMDTVGVQDTVGAMIVGVGGTYNGTTHAITLPSSGGGGLVNLTYRQGWNVGTAYAINDAVSYDGGLWSTAAAITGGAAPGTAGSNWAVVVAKGVTGATGGVWRSGAGVPVNSLGADGDLYLNSSNGDVYQRSSGVYAVIANIKGATGAGTPGADGASGWSPFLSLVTDGARRVLKIVDWVGGTGAKPTVNVFIGPSGLVTLVTDAVDVRGAQGAAGASIPAGGTLGQTLTKIDGTDYNATWVTPTGGGGGSGGYSPSSPAPLSDGYGTPYVQVNGVGSASTVSFANQTYGKFTPTSNVAIKGLVDNSQTAGLTLVAQVYRVSDNALLAQSAPITDISGVYTADFSSTLVLVAANAYYIGWSSSGRLNTKNGGAVTYSGFALENALYYGDAAGSSLANYQPIFSLRLASATVKGVQGRLEQSDINFYGGLTAARPSSPTLYMPYFDTTLGKPIWWTGASWKDATGATV